MSHVVAHLLWIIGLVLLIGASVFLYALWLPYTDPSLADVARISHQRWATSGIALLALFLIVVGGRRVRQLRGQSRKHMSV